MTKITTKDIKHISKLAKLKLTGKEEKKYSKQLESIISYIDELKEVDISSVEPTSQTTGLVNVKREDEIITGGLTQKQALTGSEKVNNDYFVVPGVIKDRT